MIAWIRTMAVTLVIGLGLAGASCITDTTGTRSANDGSSDAALLSDAGTDSGVAGDSAALCTADATAPVGDAVGTPSDFEIVCPTNGSVVSGLIHIVGIAGSQWANVAGYENGDKVAPDITPAGGSFTLPLDTTGLANGAHTITVVAFSVPAGQMGGASTSLTLELTVNNAALSPPANTALPTISGVAQVGSPLTATTGSWMNGPTSYAYQWNMDGSATSGATGATFVPVTADVNHTFTVTVTATNAAGSTSATSGPTSAVVPATGVTPDPPVTGYRIVFLQDFTTIVTLAVNPTNMGSGTWIAHTPSNKDWFTFIDPVDNYDPFGIGDGQLTIRVAKRGYGDPNNWFAGYSGGLLSSMDGAGNGFAQQYGFFEASMWCPGGPNTWPAFWLLDRPSLITPSIAGAEIDIVEEYGNWGTPPNDLQPDNYTATWHLWANGNGNDDGQDSAVSEPGLTSGYHRFGADVEPDYIVWYYDRTEVWRAPTYVEAQRPMFLLLNLALGGGTYNNATGTDYDWTLTPNPSDLRVAYVAVWASPNSPNY